MATMDYKKRATSFSLREDILSRIRMNPFLFFPLLTIREKHLKKVPWSRLRPDTGIVIEGFFRCANGFAVQAFRQAPNPNMHIASHTHAAATVIRAVKRHIPVIVLIRKPDEAVISYSQELKNFSLLQSIIEYRRFYSSIWPFRGGFVISDFKKTTSDFGQIILAVNKRFQTDFTPFEHTDVNAAKILDKISWKLKDSSGELVKLNAPDEKRSRKKERLAKLIHRLPELQPHLQSAYTLYHRYTRLSEQRIHGRS